VIDQWILVRHGETLDNLRGVTQGWTDSALSVAGQQQVQALARRVRSLGATAVFSSSLPRALATAEAIAAETGLSITPLDDLREMNCGKWEGRPFLTIREEEPETYRRWISDPQACCPEGESHADLLSRVRRAFETIQAADGPAGSRPLIVSHGMAIRMAATALLEIPITAARNFAQDNAALNIFVRRGNRLVLQLWNDTTHVEGVVGSQ
jgi:2,3-bisphosphoglycerate-dependent phosphoglycerate mutase